LVLGTNRLQEYRLATLLEEEKQVEKEVEEKRVVARY
jgi:hypothetical protein